MSVEQKAQEDTNLKPQTTWPEPPGKKGGWKRTVTIAAVVAIYLWSFWGTEFDPLKLVKGVPEVLSFLFIRMQPPSLDIIPLALKYTLQTLQIAIIGTTLAAAISFPIGFLAAKNTTPNQAVYQATRGVLNVIRTIPDLVMALIFAGAVGLGPFAGTLAVGVHSIGMLGKLYSEAVEGIDPGPVEAATASGLNRTQTLFFAVLPQVIPNFIGFTLYRWEINVRAATVVGMVGGGGIGFILMENLRLFNLHDASMILIMIYFMVQLIDYISAKVRLRII